MRFKSTLLLLALALSTAPLLTQAQAPAARYSFPGKSVNSIDRFRTGQLMGGARMVEGQLVLGDNDVDRMILPNTALDKALDFTVIAIVKLDVQHGGRFNNTGNPFNTVLSAASAVPAGGGHHRVQNINDNNFTLACYPRFNNWRIYINNNPFSFNTGTGSTEAGVWYRVAFVRRGDTGHFYFNGREIGTGVAVGHDTIHVDMGGLLLGQDQDTLGGHFQQLQSLAGRIKELTIYRQALTQSQITGMGGLIPSTDLSDSPSRLAAPSVTDAVRSDLALSTYPNPVSSGALHLALNGVKPGATLVRATLINRMGHVVRQAELPVQGGAVSHELPTAGLPTGPYVLRLTVAETGEAVSQTIVVQ